MKGWMWPVLGVGAFLVLWIVDKLTSKPTDWERRLDSAVAATKAADSVEVAAFRALHREDSVKLAAAADSVARAAERLDVAERERQRVVGTLVSTRATLRSALTLQDTVTVQAGIIAAQDRVIEADSLERTQSRNVIQRLKDQHVGDSLNAVHVETARQNAETRLAELLKVAGSRPKGFSLFGFQLRLRPAIGYGVNVNPMTGQFDHGVQLQLSVFRAP